MSKENLAYSFDLFYQRFLSAGYGLAYFTQGKYYRDSLARNARIRQEAFDNKVINVSTKISWLHWVTLICCGGSYAAFLWECGIAPTDFIRYS